MARVRTFKLTAETRTPFVNPGLLSRSSGKHTPATPSLPREPRPAADPEQEQAPPDAPEADAPSGATD